jgi:hypothetical protein
MLSSNHDGTNVSISELHIFKQLINTRTSVNDICFYLIDLNNYHNILISIKILR